MVKAGFNSESPGYSSVTGSSGKRQGPSRDGDLHCIPVAAHENHDPAIKEFGDEYSALKWFREIDANVVVPHGLASGDQKSKRKHA